MPAERPVSEDRRRRRTPSRRGGTGTERRGGGDQSLIGADRRDQRASDVVSCEVPSWWRPGPPEPLSDSPARAAASASAAAEVTDPGAARPAAGPRRRCRTPRGVRSAAGSPHGACGGSGSGRRLRRSDGPRRSPREVLPVLPARNGTGRTPAGSLVDLTWPVRSRPAIGGGVPDARLDTHRSVDNVWRNPALGRG